MASITDQLGELDGSITLTQMSERASNCPSDSLKYIQNQAEFRYGQHQQLPRVAFQGGSICLFFCVCGCVFDDLSTNSTNMHIYILFKHNIFCPPKRPSRGPVCMHLSLYFSGVGWRGW